MCWGICTTKVQFQLRWVLHYSVKLSCSGALHQNLVLTIILVYFVPALCIFINKVVFNQITHSKPGTMYNLLCELHFDGTLEATGCIHNVQRTGEGEAEEAQQQIFALWPPKRLIWPRMNWSIFICLT